MRGAWRCFYRLRFRTLLVLVMVLYVSIFIVFNYCIIPSKDETGDDSLNFIFLKSGESGVSVADHFQKEDKNDYDWNVKEFSNDNDNDVLSKITLDSQLERSTSTNNYFKSYHSDEKAEHEEEDTTHFPNDIKQSESEEHQQAVVSSLTSSSFDRRNEDGDMQALRLVKSTEAVLAASSTSEFIGNSYRSVSFNTPSQSKERKMAFEVQNGMTHVTKNISLTDKTKELATPGILLESSVNVTGPVNTIPSNVKSAFKASATESGLTNQTTASVARILSATKAPLTQEIIDSIAVNMEVRFEVLEGFDRAVITLRNKGSVPIERNMWSMYVCITTGMELHNLVHKTEGYILPQSTSIKLTHLNGCLYKIEPTNDFKTILSGKSLEFMVNIGPTLAKSDVAPRWYITAEGLEPRIISNTANETLDFVFIPKRRKSWDSFGNSDVVDLGNASLLVIPTPLQIIGLNESKKLLIDDNWVVFGERGLEKETSFLAGKLNIQKSISQSADSKVITLTLGQVPIQQTEDTNNDSYHLQTNTSDLSINIMGTGNAGVFYGVQTLLSLVNDKGEVPQVSIKDSPRFPYRGLMVDVSRNFIPKNEILKLLDVMAMYKMNKFHFHLTDNEGWRLEIPGIEELTSVGSRRCHDLQEKTCILSQLGSGPHTSTSGTGYYSTEDYREILRHAKERHIQVIPEFDFPGHSHAAIKSMIARHDRLVKEAKENEAKEFLINDFEDESRYLSVQLFTDETANTCLNSTYRFMEKVLRELTNLHHDIQPLTLYHFGGDEVAGGAWRKSPACKKLAGKLNFTYSSIHTHKKLKGYFLKQLSHITAKMNLAMAGWGDFLFERSTHTILPRDFFPNKEVYSFAWSVTGAAKNLREVSLMANHGYKVVLSNPDFIYLDHPYEPHPEERGKYWATPYTDTRKIFGFMPEDLYKDIGDDKLNCTGSDKCIKGQQNVVGVEAAMWGETVRNADHMYTMLFPRLLALAERAWHKASWEKANDKRARERERAGDWERFANTLGYRELGRLDKIGVVYRVPPPAARIIGTKLETRAALPGLKIQYSTDDGVTWNDVTSNVEVDGKLKLRTRSADDQRVSREVEIEPPTPEPVERKTEKEDDHAEESRAEKDLQTPEPMKNKTERDNYHATGNGPELQTLTKPRETDSKSEVVGQRSEQSDSTLKAQTEDERKARREERQNQQTKQGEENEEVVIQPNGADTKSWDKGEGSERNDLLLKEQSEEKYSESNTEESERKQKEEYPVTKPKEMSNQSDSIKTETTEKDEKTESKNGKRQEGEPL